MVAAPFSFPILGVGKWEKVWYDVLCRNLYIQESQEDYYGHKYRQFYKRYIDK